MAEKVLNLKIQSFFSVCTIKIINLYFSANQCNFWIIHSINNQKVNESVTVLRLHGYRFLCTLRFFTFRNREETI